MRRSQKISGSGPGSELIALPADRWQHHVKTAGVVAAGAAASAVVSTLIAATVGYGRKAISPHLVFLLIAGAIGITFEFTGHSIRRVPTGFLFAVFIFEPIGPILLHRQAAPSGIAITLMLALAGACFFTSRSHRAAKYGAPTEPALGDCRNQDTVPAYVDERDESRAVLTPGRSASE